MFGPPSPLIENYLREAEFWHVATIGRGCKLDPKLISALIERWRPETHTFHLPCRECTITLEDVHLQLGLLVDGYAVTRSVSSTDWGAVCYELLGAIADNINRGRIEMGWLRDTFSEPDNDSIELERIRYARAYILEMIESYLMPDLSRNLVHLRWLFRAASGLSWGSAVLATLYKEMCRATRPKKAKIGGCLSLLQSWARFRFPFLRPRVYHPYTFPLITRWNHSASYVRISTSLEDIRLLLDQRSEAEEDLAIRAVIPDEFLQNPNVWHVKVLLVNYATHKIDLRQLHTDWPRFWSHYIEMIHGKPYLLSEEERQRQIRAQRKRRGPLNPKRRDNNTGPSTVPTQSSGPTVQPTTPTSQPFQIMSGAYSSPYMYPNPYMFSFPSPMAGWNLWSGSSSFLITPSQPPIYRLLSHEGSSSFYQSPSPYGIQTPPSPSQHPQPDPLPKKPQPPPEADRMRNPARTRRRLSCGTDSDRHGY
ncbi:hypothetical protein GOBAR_AA35202 [Gossypium barbadense]|uniref:Aminotransferase-like plant mobile domain-containing protein n=1 Tax=Gossypium barbadense TaxID=3634 RepID=A0A2P5W305_GOSBA|nr:hypothetical protein GOBAR_AA35202 [Gossypium barbadense]